MSNILIYRQDAINALGEEPEVWSGNDEYAQGLNNQWHYDVNAIKAVLPAQPEHLTDDDFETIRIHLNAYKEKLGNQHRWEEAEEYQRIIDRFMAFASAQPERKKGKWIDTGSGQECSECHEIQYGYDSFRCFCAFCGADMRGEQNE